MSIDTKELLLVAYRTAARILHNRVIAEEAGEQAVHRLHLAVLAGKVPEQPKAWVRTVARRSACSMLRNGWSRMRPIEEASHVAERPASGGALDARALLDIALTRRQRQALEAAMSCRTTNDAARCCGMEPRDFRRHLAAITNRARKHFRARESQGAR